MDWAAHRLANALVANNPGAAAIEVTIGGIELEPRGVSVTLAIVAPGFAVQLNGKPLTSPCRLDMQEGERLAIRPGTHGMWAYVAIAARLDLPLVMGSLATHTRSELGGLEGRALLDGDELPILAARLLGSATLDGYPPEASDAPIRVVPGPQADFFDNEGLSTFFNEPFVLTAQMDRMAYKLDGPQIRHAKGFNIVSDGIALGAIQVPGNGRPLVLMADRQPTGGYPKIATIIRSDVRRFAQLRAGSSVRFEAVSVEAATADLRRLTAEIAAAADRTVAVRGSLPDSARLLGTNLIDGVISAIGDP